MELIQNNPYRIAGILSNATVKELHRQKAKIRAYSRVGKEINSDYDFNVLNNLKRTEASVDKAFSSIEQNQDKVNNALFWFLNASPLDNTAIEYLKNGNEEKAAEIWEKVTKGKEPNAKNYSCFNNLGTLKLLGKTQTEIQEGIEAKIKLIESESFNDFVHTVADQTFTIDNKKQVERLVDNLLLHYKNRFSSSETLELFENCNGTTKKYLLSKTIEEPLHNIESQITNTKKKRRQHSDKANEFGIQLYANCKKDLSMLQSLLGTNDLKYKMIADNLAKEIMQCGIDYFKEWQDAKDPSDEGLKLLKYAKSIAVGSQTKERVKENIEGIREWAETAPIKEDLAFITSKLASFQNSSDTIPNAKALVSSCKSKLQNVRNILGSNDEFYLNISSAVVSNALGMIIEVVNEAQSGLQYNRVKLLKLPDIIKDAVSALNTLASIDMNSETRQRFSENKSIIISLNNQLTAIRKQASSYNTSSNNSSSVEEGGINWGSVIGWGIGIIILLRACAG
ncbi:MAG: hypothetical protein P1U70_18730 [Saprospiraceae bacterium]|nr:hypothetical protein [Saprospiraceae bacterium]